MSKPRRFVIGLLVVMALAIGISPAGASNCSPGQHGNPHPGFKPGNCK